MLSYFPAGLQHGCGFDVQRCLKFRLNPRIRMLLDPDVRDPGRARVHTVAKPGPFRFSVSRLGSLCGRLAAANDRIRESLHLFHLRAELKQQEASAGLFEFADAIRDLLRRADKARAEPAV